MRVIVWNVGAGRPWREVRGPVRWLVDQDPPDRLVLLEAGGYLRRLRSWPWLRRRWRVISRRSDVVVLSPRTQPRPQLQRLGHGVPWVGPKQGRVRQGRRWLVEHTTVGALLYVHRVPGGPSGGVLTRGANATAWHAEHRLIIRWASMTRGRLLIVGDQNCRPTDWSPRSVARLAHAVRGRLVQTGLAVDYAVTRGQVAVQVDVLPRFGSDHHAVAYDLEE